METKKRNADAKALHVVALLAEGKNGFEIAECLGIPINSVRSTVERVAAMNQEEVAA